MQKEVIMFKKPILAICLCGVTWAGTCQAGFLGNDQDLQFLHNMINSVDTNTGATGSDNATQGNGQYNPSNGPDNSQIDKSSNSQNRPGDLSIVALNDSVTQHVGANLAATVPEPGTFYLMAMGLSLFGLSAYRRRGGRTEAPPGADQS
jgi:hypothetical protein